MPLGLFQWPCKRLNPTRKMKEFTFYGDGVLSESAGIFVSKKAMAQKSNDIVLHSRPKTRMACFDRVGVGPASVGGTAGWEGCAP